MNKKNKISVDKTALLYALNAAAKVAATSPSHLTLYNNLKIQAEDGGLVVAGSNGDNLILVRVPDDGIKAGDLQAVLIPSGIVSVITALRGDAISLSRDGNGIRISDGIESPKMVAIFDDSGTVSVNGETITYSPGEFRQMPEIAPDHPTNRMTAILWQKIVSRCATVGIDNAYPGSVGILFSGGPGKLQVSTLKLPTTVMAWDVPEGWGYKLVSPLRVLVPKAAAAAIPVSGSDIAFGVAGNSFFVRDWSGLWEFHCATLDANRMPDISPVLSLPFGAEASISATELARCCGIASSFMLVVGEERGQVRTGRVRLVSDGSDVTFYTASDMGEFSGTRIPARTTAGEFDVTLANAPLKAAMTCFAGSVHLEVADSFVRFMPVPDDGLRYILAPLAAVW